MKFFSHLYLLLLCSATLSHAMRPSRTTLNIKRSKLTKEIRSINIKIAAFEQEHKNHIEYTNLHKQLLSLLERKKETYIDRECLYYQKCVANIKHISDLIEKHPQSLTLSIMVRNNLKSAQSKAAQSIARAEATELLALKKLEAMIIDKIETLPQFFAKFDLEELVIAQDKTNNPWQKKQLEFMFEIKKLWFETSEKTSDLCKQLTSKAKQGFINIYSQWLVTDTDPAWLDAYKSNLKNWKQLQKAMSNLEKNIEDHPAKKIIYQNISKQQKERLTLIKQYFAMQKQLEQNPAKQTKIDLSETIRSILQNLEKEHAEKSPSTPNKYIIYLGEKLKRLKTEIDNESSCTIL